MRHDQFRTGLEFWCGNKRWRCTDVGSRVVVAISLEPHEVVNIDHVDGDPRQVREHRFMTDDPNWLNSPPFAVAEYVFDEYDMQACLLHPDHNADKDAAG